MLIQILTFTWYTIKYSFLIGIVLSLLQILTINMNFSYTPEIILILVRIHLLKLTKKIGRTLANIFNLYLLFNNIWIICIDYGILISFGTIIFQMFSLWLLPLELFISFNSTLKSSGYGMKLTYLTLGLVLWFIYKLLSGYNDMTIFYTPTVLLVGTWIISSSSRYFTRNRLNL